MPTIHLSDRALVRVSGPDAEHFLQNIITADISALPADVAKPSALLTPQGKIMFDFLVSRDGGDGYLLDIRADLADDFVRRLMLYRLRAKAEIAKPDQQLVYAAWETDSASSQNDSTAPGLHDTRFRGLDVRRTYGSSPAGNGEREAWDRLRIAHGVAESGSAYAAGDAFPHDVLLDQFVGWYDRYLDRGRVDRAANMMQSLGLRREERIAIAMHDSADWVAVFLGAIKAGVVPVAMNMTNWPLRMVPSMTRTSMTRPR